MKKAGLILSFMLMLSSCGGGGGSSAPDVDPGPPPSNQAPPPATPEPAPDQLNTYTEAVEVQVNITGVEIGETTQIHLTLADGDNFALTGLTSGNVRIHIAKLIPAANGDSTRWQSYINRQKTPNVNPQNPPAIQATSERGGELVDHGDGSYTYTMATDIRNVTEPLAVIYEPSLTHRVAIQFSGGVPVNPVYDWVPMTGATAGIETRNIATTETCNTCHNPLAIHGGGRIEQDMCVVCHNLGTTEPNSLEEMDMAAMTHRIHMGKDLPSVIAGDPYIVWGYRDSSHDYSDLVYPQDVISCAKCHTGSATADAPITAVSVTSDGDNWHEVPTMAACGSCHDDLNFSTHAGGQTDNSGCQSCHSASGIAGSVIGNHRNDAIEDMAEISVAITSVQNAAPGQQPMVTFSVTNPKDDTAYDILTDSRWTDGRLRLALAWNTDEFTNTGASTTGKPYYARTDALTSAIDNGDGTYTMTSDVAIPDGTQPPFRAASGSGLAIFEGRMKADDGYVPFVQEPYYFAIDDATAQPRRQVVSAEKCNACHGVMKFHGDLRTNTEVGCQACHHPRLATDAGESIEMRRMTHGIHAAAVRDNPLVIRGEPFDTDVVHFPGEIADCRTCHVDDSFQLPLADTVLGVTVDMGSDVVDPADDTIVTAQTSTCTGCHDDDLARAHMEQNGADFEATEASIESGVSTETCEICHGEGRSADVTEVHGLNNPSAPGH
ncbi:MAG: OmcA/MtrC family decaheme c-type cytochrome [Gammaproteobacteria bacterium]|jgi:OmcA/MtrC family decaheme c-type cytochrome|nr:OmcA/MtrC family decaheme c-type cytochrome [Gammaproteobacteria bacterium]MBT7371532.1 OmcA/MtrC family decaheme c-type cytochrome [Gammaproteobacteria bacterium]